MQEKTGYLKSLRIIHQALLAGVCVFLAVMVFLVMKKATPFVDTSLDKILQVIALLVSFGSVFTGSSLFKKKLLIINTTASSLADKAQQYRAANILRWALIEGASLFTIICFFLTGNYSFAALAIALIVFFAMTAPSRLKAMLQLQLSEQEFDKLQ